MGVPDPLYSSTLEETDEQIARDIKDVLGNSTLTQTGTHFRFDVRAVKTLTNGAKSKVSQNLILPVQFVFWHSIGKYTEWWTDGMNYHPHYPALIDDTTSRYEEIWRNSFGSMCRDGGPGHITHTYGKSYAESWFNSDLLPHRGCDLPAAITIRNMETKNATRRLEWHRNGVMYRITNGPSTIEDRGFTEEMHIASDGTVIRIRKIKTKELIWTNDKGQLHRTTGPAKVLLHDVTETYKNCDQSPIQYVDWSGRWWVNDEYIPNHNLHEWARKYKVPMRNGPCLTQNAFTTSGGEMYFLSDIAARTGK